MSIRLLSCIAAASCGLLLIAGCGSSRSTQPEPEPMVEEGPTAAELEAMHEAMREQATATVTGQAGEDRLDYDDGRHERTLDDGRTEIANFEGGLLDGPYSRTYPNGQKEIEAVYDDGRKDGPWKTWYANGQQFEEGTYRAGERHGTWSSWYENGQLMEKAVYDGGHLIRTYGAYLADGTEIALEPIPRNP